MGAPVPSPVVYRAKAMRLDGMTWAEIGGALGYNADTLRVCVRSAWPEIGGRLLVPVSADQLAAIKEMFGRGYGVGRISERTGLGKKVVQREIIRLGLIRGIAAAPAAPATTQTRRCLGHDDASQDGRCTRRLPKGQPLFLCTRCSPSNGRARPGKDHHA